MRLSFITYKHLIILKKIIDFYNLLFNISKLCILEVEMNIL